MVFVNKVTLNPLVLCTEKYLKINSYFRTEADILHNMKGDRKMVSGNRGGEQFYIIKDIEVSSLWL